MKFAKEIGGCPRFCYWTDPGLARLLSERSGSGNGALFETSVLCELLRWRSWQPVPPDLFFHRTHGGGEVGFILRTPHCTLALEAKAGRAVHSSDIRPLRAFVGAPRKGLLGIVIYEVGPVESGVWAVPAWRLFAPASEWRNLLPAASRVS